MEYTDGETLVKIEILGKSIDVPLFFFSSCLTSHSLALTEWEKKYQNRFLEKLNPKNPETSKNALEELISSQKDVDIRRQHLESIEKLWK